MALSLRKVSSVASSSPSTLLGFNTCLSALDTSTPRVSWAATWSSAVTLLQPGLVNNWGILPRKYLHNLNMSRLAWLISTAVLSRAMANRLLEQHRSPTKLISKKFRERDRLESEPPVQRILHESDLAKPTPGRRRHPIPRRIHAQGKSSTKPLSYTS